MRGRTPPPRQAAPTVEQMAARLAGQTGLFMLEYRHDDGCPTIDTQRWEDCTCDQVDHQLLRYQPEGGKR
jgi:hypothetical protein